MVHAVVGHAAAKLGELVQPRAQGLRQRRKARRAAQAGKISKIVLLFNAHGLVRAEGGQDLHGEVGFPDFFVPFQAVRRVVGGADHFDLGAEDQISCGKIRLRQLFAAELPDLLRVFRGQMAVEAEVVLQLKMAPVVEWVSRRQGQGFGPGLKLFPVGRLAGDRSLVHAEAAHQPPLVVVAAKPELRDVVKVPVLIDLSGVQVAMIVDDRQRGCKLVIQMLCCVIGQQKLTVHKLLHGSNVSLLIQRPSAGFGMK